MAATPASADQQQTVPSTRTGTGAVTYPFSITPGSIDSMTCPGRATYKARVLPPADVGVLPPVNDKATLTIQPSVQIAETKFDPTEIYAGTDTTLVHQATLQVSLKASRGVTGTLTVGIKRASVSAPCIATTPVNVTDTGAKQSLTFSQPTATGTISVLNFTVKAGTSNCAGTATYQALFSPTPTGVVILPPQETAVLTVLYRTVKITTTMFDPTSVSIGGAATTLTVTVAHSASMSSARVTVQIQQTSATPLVTVCTNVVATPSSATQQQTVPSTRTGTGTLTYTFTITPPSIDSTGCPGTITYQTNITSVTGVTGVATLTPADDNASLTIKPSVRIVGAAFTPTAVANGSGATLVHYSTLAVSVKVSRGVTGTLTVGITRTARSSPYVNTTPSSPSQAGGTQSVTFAQAAGPATTSTLNFTIQAVSASAAGTATYQASISGVPTGAVVLTPATGSDTAVLTVVAAPAISSITPTSGQQGESLTVTFSGSNLTVTGAPTVTINQAQMFAAVTSASATQIRTTVGIPWSIPPATYALAVNFPLIGFLTANFSVQDRPDQPPIITSVSPAKESPVPPPAGTPPVAAVPKSNCVGLTITGQNLVGATASVLREESRSFPSVIQTPGACNGQVTGAVNWSDTSMRVFLDTSGVDVEGYYSLVISNATPASELHSALLPVEVTPSKTEVYSYWPDHIVREQGAAILIVSGKNLPSTVVESRVGGPPVLEIEVNGQRSSAEVLVATLSLREDAPAGRVETALKVEGWSSLLNITIVEKAEELPSMVTLSPMNARRRMGNRLAGGVGGAVRSASAGVQPAAAYSPGDYRQGMKNETAGSVLTPDQSASAALLPPLWPRVEFRYTLWEDQYTKVLGRRLDGQGRAIGPLPQSLGINESMYVGGVVISAFFRDELMGIVTFESEDPTNPDGIAGSVEICFRTVAGTYVSGGMYVLGAYDTCTGVAVLTYGPARGGVSNPVLDTLSGCLGVKEWSELGLPAPSPGIFLPAEVRNRNGWEGCCGGTGLLHLEVASANVIKDITYEWETPPLPGSLRQTLIDGTEWNLNQSLEFNKTITLAQYHFSPRIKGVSMDPPTVEAGQPAMMTVEVEIPKTGSVTEGMESPGLYVTVDVVPVSTPFCPCANLQLCPTNPLTEATVSSRPPAQFVREGGSVPFVFGLTTSPGTVAGTACFEARIEDHACALSFTPSDPNSVRTSLTVEPPPQPPTVQISVDTQQDPNIVLADGAAVTMIRATAKDSSENPVAGVPLTFSASFGSLPNATATTDSSGRASVTYTAGTLPEGSTNTTAATINVSVSGVRQDSTATVYNYRGFTFNDLTITNEQHNNANDMTEAQIQQFFEQRGSFLARFVLSTQTGEGFYDSNNNGVWDAGEPVYEPRVGIDCTATPDHTQCNNRFDGAQLEAAARTFLNAAQANGINPKVLIVTAEKEFSLISRTTLPGNRVLNCAMGYRADICETNSNYKSQLSGAANTLRRRFDDSMNCQDRDRWFQDRCVTFPFFVRVTNSDADIRHRLQDGTRIRVSFWLMDGATYAQYRYTPHIQSLPGGGGVYLFERVWNQYQPLWPR